MADSAQNFSNHAKFDPPFHFFMGPVFMINVIVTIVALVRNPSWMAGWIVVVSLAALVAVFKIRIYSLKVQDRVIRLEERLRLASLLSDPWKARLNELTESQLVGLRFASDGEVPALVQRCLSESLKNADIKKAVLAWRPDFFRV